MSGGGGRKHKVEEPENHERWLVSYADFITLLFAFFTTMYAISNVDNKKLNSMVESMREAFGGGRDTASPRPMPRDAENATNRIFDIIQREEDWRIRSRAEIKVLKKKVDEKVKGLGITGAVRTVVDERGLVVHVSEACGFQPGRAEIRRETYPLFDALGNSIKEMDNDIQVQGHTDNKPISNSMFRSNWELSTTRATNVLRYLIDRFRIPPKRFSAAGYGEYYPMADNRTEEGRSKNRRVDIIVLLTRYGVESEMAAKTASIGH
jgi:chemotaxis protein MotB